MKFDKEIVEEAKKEVRKRINQNSIDEAQEIKTEETYSSSNNNVNSPSENQTITQDSVIDEKFKKFADKLQNYSGRVIVEYVDDFKSNLLWIYAKKNKVEIPKEAFKMPEESKDLCSTLVDFAIQDKLLEYIKKYPLLAAGALISINAISGFVVINALKENKEQSERENDKKPETKDTAEEIINNL
ncbi:MAG: hypothetical protein N3F62_06705 [Bacteroidia bacterium]|nr:hypothetical protein [Bacteroidia bacterium]